MAILTDEEKREFLIKNASHPGYDTQPKFESYIRSVIRSHIFDTKKEHDLARCLNVYGKGKDAFEKMSIHSAIHNYIERTLNGELPLTFDFVNDVSHFSGEHIDVYFPFNRDLSKKEHDTIYTKVNGKNKLYSLPLSLIFYMNTLPRRSTDYLENLVNENVRTNKRKA